MSGRVDRAFDLLDEELEARRERSDWEGVRRLRAIISDYLTSLLEEAV